MTASLMFLLQIVYHQWGGKPCFLLEPNVLGDISGVMCDGCVRVWVFVTDDLIHNDIDHMPHHPSQHDGDDIIAFSSC